MKNRLARVRETLRGNCGSGIVLVMITLLFVTLLGATLLYTTYTSYRVKLTDRDGKRNFYDASSMLDQVTAGVQQTASDAIAGAYKTVLAQYAELTDPETFFVNEFQKELLPADDSKPVYRAGGKYLYSVKALYDFVDVPAGAELSLNGYTGSGAGSPGTVKLNGGTVTLEKVSLTYIDRGYETNVTTDICIDMPEFYQYNTKLTISGLPAYALVARTKLQVDSSTTLAGNAYAGEVAVTTGEMTVAPGATLVSGGVVHVVQGGSKLTQSTGASLWTTDLRIDGQSKVTLGGGSYLKDDLELRSGATAVLAGDYYGFGTSETKPDESSAILANGSKAVLDLSNASTLFLAGNSFVKNNTAALLMGESVAAKSDQLLYLLPDAYLGGAMTSNPIVVAGTPNLADYTAAIPAAVAEKYGASATRLTYPLGTGTSQQSVIYQFIQFDTLAHANQFFKDQFDAHPEQVQDYLNRYLTIQGEADSLRARGYSLDGNGQLQNLTTPAAMANTAARLSGFYENLCVNLTTSKTKDSAADPYAYYIDDAKVRALGEAKVTGDVDGEAWLVTGGNYSVPAENAPALIIAAGNVTVSGDYTGLILSGGTITVSSSATIATGLNSDALLTAVSDYRVDHGGNKTPENEDAKETWGLDELVYYKNWNKQ